MVLDKRISLTFRGTDAWRVDQKIKCVETDTRRLSFRDEQNQVTSKSGREPGAPSAELRVIAALSR